MLNVVLTSRATKNFRKLPEEMQNRCQEIFDALQNSFAPLRLDVKKLKGYENTYRIRLGKWRIIYKVDTKKKLILIYDILPRKKAY